MTLGIINILLLLFALAVWNIQTALEWVILRLKARQMGLIAYHEEYRRVMEYGERTAAQKEDDFEPR